jgi:hypothetical protein
MMSTPLKEGAPPKHRTRKRLIILCDGGYDLRLIACNSLSTDKQAQEGPRLMQMEKQIRRISLACLEP